MGNAHSNAKRRSKDKAESSNASQTRSSPHSQRGVELSSDVSGRTRSRDDKGSSGGSRAMKSPHTRILTKHKPSNHVPCFLWGSLSKIEGSVINSEKKVPKKTIRDFLVDSEDSASVSLKQHYNDKMFYDFARQLITLKDKFPDGDDKRYMIDFVGATFPWYRPVQNDDGLFYKSFLFAYVEHIWLTEDKAEASRVIRRLERCRSDGICSSNLGNHIATFDELLREHTRSRRRPLTHGEFLSQSWKWKTDTIVLLFLDVVATWLSQHSLNVFDPSGQFKSEAERLSGHSEIRGYRELTALSVALEVPIHVEVLTNHPPCSFDNYLPDVAKRNSSSSQPAESFINLLYWSEVNSSQDCYDILYRSVHPDKSSEEIEESQ